MPNEFGELGLEKTRTMWITIINSRTSSARFEKLGAKIYIMPLNKMTG